VLKFQQPEDRMSSKSHYQTQNYMGAGKRERNLRQLRTRAHDEQGEGTRIDSLKHGKKDYK